MSNPNSYPGVFSAFKTMFAQEGPSAFYKGFFANFTRLALWSTILFMSRE